MTDTQWAIVEPLLPPPGNTTIRAAGRRNIRAGSSWTRSSTWPEAGSPGGRCPATLLLVVVVTAAHIQDRDGAHRLLAALRARFSTVSHLWADGGYTGRLLP
jgi:transposase